MTTSGPLAFHDSDCYTLHDFPSISVDCPQSATMLVTRSSSVNQTLHRLLFSLGLLLALCSSASAQAISDGAVSGMILDPTGAIVAGASITLQCARTRQEPLSGESGLFRFVDVPGGTCQVTVSSAGFKPFIQDILVRTGKPAVLRVELAIQVQQQRIDVGGDTLDTAPEHNQDAIILKGQGLRALATDPLQLRLELQSMAGSISGTQFFIDGFSAGRLPPKAAIQEIRINDNPDSAQWDTTGLGRVEIVTKPGADSLHGTVSLIGEYSTLNSQNPFVTYQPAYSAFYVEGSASSRIGAHSSWLLDGDGQNVGAQSFVHTVTSSTGPAYTATVSSPRTSIDLGPRFDFQLGKIQTISLRYQFDHQQQNNLVQTAASLQSQAVNTRHTDQTLQFSDMQAYSERFLNETRFQFLRTNDSSVSLNRGPGILVEGAFNGGGNFMGQLHDGQNHYELQNYSS